MTRKDIIYAVICGLSVAWIGIDFFCNLGLILIIILPLLSIFGLWLADLLGRKNLIVRQAAKFVLAGAFADVIDIKAFQFLFLFIPFPLSLKTISFIIATFVKYVADKYWAFEKFEKEDIHKEAAKFFMVAVIGLLINVVSFYLFGKI